MKDIVHAVLFGFKEILGWNVMKYALVGGLIASALWAIVGYMFWEELVSLGSYVQDLIPFSMVRSNSAWMLSSFLWFQLVLVTFALIFAFFGHGIIRNISKDKYPSFSLYIAFGSAIVWAVVWFFKGDDIYHKFLDLLNKLPFETIEKGVGYFLALYILYNAIIVTMVFIANIFSKPLINSLYTENIKGHTIKTVGYTIKDTLIFLVVSLLLFPLLFVPILNLLIMIALWVWLVRDTFRYDALSLLGDKIDKDMLKEHNKASWIISLIASLFNFVPVLNLFGPFFGEIAMFEYFKEQHNKKTK